LCARAQTLLNSAVAFSKYARVGNADRAHDLFALAYQRFETCANVLQLLALCA
jgi:hypothetical protein